MNRYFHKDIIKSNNYQSLDYLEQKTIEKSKKTEETENFKSIRTVVQKIFTFQIPQMPLTIRTYLPAKFENGAKVLGKSTLLWKREKYIGNPHRG